MDKKQLTKILSWNISTQPEIRLDYVLEQLKLFDIDTDTSELVKDLEEKQKDGITMVDKEEMINKIGGL